MSPSPGYSPATVDYLNGNWTTSDPRKIAANLQQINAQGAQAGQANANATQGFLDPIEQRLASGQGGYSPDELSQIQMTPEQQRDIVNRAGTTAGAATAAGVDAATRASNAAGGNPAAVAAYRARAAQQEGSQAADAMTGARVGASNAAAQRAENIGQTRIGQQNVGLGLQQQYQQQQNQNSQNAQNRQVQGSQIGLQASQTPSTFDKIMGGIGGALGGGALSFLDEGGGAGNAIVAENGPEAVVDMKPRFLEDGSGEASEEGMGVPSSSTQMGDDAATNQPWYKRFMAGIVPQPSTGQAPGAPAHLNASGPTPPSMQSAQTLGRGIGAAARGISNLFLEDGWTGQEPGTWDGSSDGSINSMSKFLDDGAMGAADGAIFTKPTEVKMGPHEAAVPLGYRARAKTRPSMAMPVVNEIQKRRMYGGA